MKVENNKMVALRYSIRNSKGNVITDIMSDAPFRYTYGSGGILPALEQNIYGMDAGEQRSFALLKDEQPGLFEDLYIDVIIDEVADAAPDGMPQSTAKTNCSDGDCCC
ncbi:FKBP-type peptidyl-prolyl cis-trans isomerase [Mucilaginibacter sp.]|jgi:FKBP-type peptidyl-prolyl cis-trans isomerase SlyD|uniref:FKBP-type peptidyl-prolyl cis-trans isomerase n=1 Tax=Mucilaginibacter sp. TaxID=1882438 RepID=UPI002CA2D702|nr:FKBP-type peptidyl-prolyl cis-trans isomerase [Mucilaginibacter sp.]HTI58141.1 FKBP-type peptidyl-prolyl cis-trans isomerase [Mucilaginibacter sp.]